MKHPRLAVALVGTLALPVLAACTDNTTSAAGKGDDRTISVTSTDDSCDLSTDKAPSGNLVYKVKNQGNKVTEFYLYGEDGLRIVGEVENVGPGLSRDLVINVPAGRYVPACKPGMVGKGIRSDFTVTDSGETSTVSGASKQQVATANAQYKSYVRDQTEQLLAGTKQFVAVYKAGDDDKARALYAPTRVHWERIETVAESFGDLDPMMDAREADLEPGEKWTGWHLIENDLWPERAEDYTPLTDAERATYADDLMANTTTLDTRIDELTFTVDQIANGSRGLLEEVATGKVTGEEEYWSRTDLWDFQANVDGARVGYDGVAPLVERKDPELATLLDTRFDELQVLLDEQRDGDDFTYYDDLTQDEIKDLASAVNALSEPLSRLTAVVLG